MTFLRRFVLLILLLAWVPASSHCLLAAVLQNAAVSDCCVDSQKTQTTGSHNNSDCCPFCDTFESGKILTSSKSKLDTDEGVIGLINSITSLMIIQNSKPAISFIPHKSSHETVSWQFETRSARTGRSPNVSL